MGKLLVVDDDAALRRLMRLELSDTYEVIDSGEPEQGLAIALESRPDAILLDLRMPKYSGYELLQTFTSFSHTQKIPVIVVSGEAGSQTKEHCKQLGAAGYFEKPIDFDALRVCLRQVAKHRHDPPRSEVRVRLRVPLKLRGANDQGTQIEEQATTENVSIQARSVFSIPCAANRIALLGSSPVDRIIANFFLGVHVPPCPTRFFTSRDESMNWLRQDGK